MSVLDRKKDWYKDLIIYQIYPKSFMDSNNDGIGDLQGIITKLDYIKSVGANAIWISPIYKSPFIDNGYDISDYMAIDPVFGSFKDFEMLRDECHKKGIYLIMDLVINHTSCDHMWFKESSKSRTNKYSDYYIWKDPVNGKEPNNWASVFGGSAWEYEENRKQYYLHLFAKQQPDLNWDSESVQKEVFEIIDWWASQGIDGFRVDAISYLEKCEGFKNSSKTVDKDGYVLDTDISSNRPKTHKIIQKIRCEIFDKYNLVSVGEVNCIKDSDYYDYASDSRKEFNMIIPFIPPNIEIRNWSPIKMKKTINETYSFLQKDGWWARFLSNHDKPRQVSLYGDVKHYWEQSAKLLATIIHMLPGTPFIYQGEEIGMTNIEYDSIEKYNDIDTINTYNAMIKKGTNKDEALSFAKQISRDNARSPMQWNVNTNAGFSSSIPWIPSNPNYLTINVDRQEKDCCSILNYYRALTKIRISSEAIRRGKFKMLGNEGSPIFDFIRWNEKEKYRVIANFSKSILEYSLKDFNEWGVLLSNYSFESLSSSLLLRPYETLVFQGIVTVANNS